MFVLFETRLELCLQTVSSSDVAQIHVWSQSTTSGEGVVKRNVWALFQHAVHISFLSMHLAKTCKLPLHTWLAREGFSVC